MKTGIFGGTFDPIHNCHLHIAEQVRAKAGLDRIIFVVSSVPPHRGGIVDADHRLEMTRLAVTSYPAFDVSDSEIKRPGPSYTIDTIREFQRDLPGAALSFILGIDAFAHLDSWRAPAELLNLCDFIVVSRSACRFRDLTRMPLIAPLDEAALQALDRDDVDRVVHSLPGGRSLIFLRIDPCLISGTRIRKTLAERRSLKNLLPPSVESYIIEKALYLDQT